MRNPEVQQQMFAFIDRWKASGLSQKSFCEQESVPYNKFYYWYRRYRKQGMEPQKTATRGFVELQVEEPPAVTSVEIHFPQGIRLLFHHPVSAGYLKNLLS